MENSSIISVTYKKKRLRADEAILLEENKDILQELDTKVLEKEENLAENTQSSSLQSISSVVSDKSNVQDIPIPYNIDRRIKITEEVKLLCVRLYLYVDKQKKREKQQKKKKINTRPTREIVADMLGIGSRTVQDAYSDYLKSTSATSSSPDIPSNNAESSSSSLGSSLSSSSVLSSDLPPWSSPSSSLLPTYGKYKLDRVALETILQFVRDMHATSRRVTASQVTSMLTTKGFLDPNIKSSSNLRKVQRFLVKHGFQRGCQNGTMKIEQKEAVKLKRNSYLNAIVQARKESRPLVFLDESYIHQHHHHVHDNLFHPADEKDKPNKHYFKGRRYCFVAAMTEQQFLRNSVWIFESKKTGKDYHSVFNGQNFMNWVKTQLLPNIPPSSVIILDNAKYHKCLPSTIPKLSAKKHILTDFLAQKGIDTTAKTLAQVKELLKEYTSKCKLELEEVAEAAGHQVLFTPPYHSDLQPIELVWANVKGKVARQYSSTTKLTDVLERLNTAFDEVSEGAINKIMIKTRTVEEAWMQIDAKEALQQEQEEIQSVQQDRSDWNDCDDGYNREIDEDLEYVSSSSDSDSEDLSDDQNEDEPLDF